MGDIPYDRLAAMVYGHVFDRDLLLASATVSLERLDLRGKGPGKLVQGALRAVLLG
jgi:hypothetical protein